jgi:hypothetical protein
VSYSEENGQVVLRMSVADYEELLLVLGEYTARAAENRSILSFSATIRLLNRLNARSPIFTPYQVT